MKRKLTVMMLTILTMMLVGCTVRTETDVAIGAGGTVNLTIALGMDDDFFVQYAEQINSMGGDRMTADEVKAELKKSYEESGAVVTNQVIDGLNYMMVTKAKQNQTLSEAETMLTEELSLKNVCLTKTYFYATTAENTDSSQTSDMTSYTRFSVTFPEPVINTNGEVDPTNACKVSWESTNATDTQTYYATTTEVSASVNASLTSVKNGKIYKANKKIQLSDTQDLVKLTLKNTDTDTVATIKDGYTVKKNGNYTITAWFANGTCQSVSFCLDKKMPTIKGAKNGKVYKKNVTLTFVDDVSGIQSVTVNGKKISAKKYDGYTVKKNGKYKVVVKDKAGNKKKITFRIKK